MARAATTADVCNAIAEQQRREILVLLRAGEGPVTELAQELGMTQPGASKHLRVLREVGLVRDRKAGKQRLYGLDARGLRPVHDWTGGFAPVSDERLAQPGAGRAGPNHAGPGGGGMRPPARRAPTPTAPPALRDEAVEKYHAIEGGQQTLSNLAAYVTEIVRKGVED